LIVINDVRAGANAESGWRLNEEAAGVCLGIPMQIVSTQGISARCEAKGVTREVGLLFMQHEALGPGDFVMVHGGQAMQKMTAGEARAAWDLYDEMLRMSDARGAA
jgi:hydrogenase expression/formation protein HypC